MLEVVKGNELLADTVAVVTGASSGIGAATALRLASDGATVVLVARRVDRLETVAERIRVAGGAAVVLPRDLTDPEHAADAIAETVAQQGRLDILVNNAGLMLLGPSTEASIEEWRQMLAINVSAVLHATHAALPHLLQAAKTGRRQVADLVNISSTAGKVARPGGAVYALTKFGLGAFTESLRKEHTQHHLRVGVVEPGGTNTELMSHLRPEVRASMSGPSTETLQPEDVADAVAYMVTRPRHVAINELLVRPTEQDA